VDGVTGMPSQRPSELDSEQMAASLWRTTHAFWALPDVEETCLEWQASFGLDVSIFCWAAWAAGLSDIALSEADVGQAAAAVDEWRISVITPIRAARKRVRTAALNATTPPVLAAYRALRAAELAAERAEQQMLVDWVIKRPRRAGQPLGVYQAMRTVVGLGGAAVGSVARARLEVMAEQFEGLLRQRDLSETP
jgi:uncharacterized protein (TIGR02444 family)